MNTNTIKNKAQEYAVRIREELLSYCNGEEINKDVEQSSLHDYLAKNTLNMEAIIASNGAFKACRVYITLGGPACWIDTEERAVKCVWGADSGSAWIGDVADEVEDIIAEYYDGVKVSR